MKRLFATIVLSLFASALPTYAQSQGESVGAMGGTFSVSPMGGATYTIPIQVPQGVGGMEPQLSIVYNSQAGNGLCGYGTNLAGFSSITRVPKDIYHDGAAGGVKYLADDALYLDGVRLIHMSGTEGQDGATYSPESDPFTTVIAHGTCSSSQNNIWYEVQSSDGMIYWYDTQLTYSKDGSQRIHSWYLSRAIQPDSNYIDYMYDEVDNYMYPFLIAYGSNENNLYNPLSNTIQFDYETRNDSIPVRFDGKKGTINKRLKTITCKTNDEVFRTYTLNYNDTGDGTATKYSRLTNITEKNAQNECLPSTQFNWAYLPYPTNDASDITINPPANIPANYTLDNENQSFFSGDVNGDGVDDLISLTPATSETNGWIRSFNILNFHYSSVENGFRVFKTSSEGLSDYFEVDWLGSNTLMTNKLKGEMVLDFDGDGTNECILPVFKEGESYSHDKIRIQVLGKNICDSQDWALQTKGEPLTTTADINNDGKGDLVVLECAPYNGTYRMRIYQMKDDYIPGSHHICKQTQAALSLTASPKKLYAIDMNGNGMTDLLVQYNTGYTVFWNQGGCIYSDSYRTDVTGVQWPERCESGDFDGDGLLDFIANAKNSKQWYFHLNNGDGTFKVVPAMTFCLQDLSFLQFDDLMHLLVMDFDGDGKSDIIITKADYSVLWKGTNHYLSPELIDYYVHNDITTLSNNTIKIFNKTYTYWYKSTGTSLAEVCHASSNNESDAYQWRFNTGDFDGDGRTELINLGYDCAHGLDASGSPSWRMYKTDGLSAQSGKVTSVTGDFGSTTSITYSTLTDSDVYTPGAPGSYPVCRYTIPLNVVKTVTQDNGAAGSQTSSYSYSGLKAHLQGKGLLGYSSTRVVNNTLGTIYKTEIKNWNNTYYVPHLTRTTAIVVGESSSQTDNVTTIVGKSRKRFFAYPSQTLTTDFDGNTVETRTVCDTISGNITLESTSFWNDTDMYVQTQYQNYTTHLPGRSNKPQRVVVTRQYPGDTPFTTITEYSYDAKGHIIQRCDNAQSSSLHLTTSYTYDLWGNLTSETACGSGVAELTTYYSYDATHRFPVRIYTNPSSTVQKFSYDLWGNILTEQDSINPGIENLITHTYDGWGNRVRTQISGSGEVTYAKGWGSSNAQRFYTMEQGTARPWVRTWYDSRGREVMTESIGADDMPVSSVMAYDGKGQRISETETTGNLTLTHNYEYDDRGRLMRETNPGGNVIEYTYSLDGHSKTVSDNGRQTTYTYDAVGNLLEVQSPLSSSLAHTYSSNGGIKQTVTDGATWTVSYDECGNRISMTDPDAGTTTYAYDALGRERERIDGRGVVFLTNYDYLGRVTSMTAGNETTTYTYGTGGNGQMRLTSESNGCWTKSYTYDRYGRVNNETMTKIGDSYSRSMTYRYNASGLLSGKDYPDGKSVEYAYDAYGNCTTVNFEENKLLWRLTGNTGKTATSTLALFNSSTPYVRTTQLDNVGNLQSRIMTHGGTTLQNDSYVFDPQNGNLLSRTLTGHPTETFTYDALDRLTRAICPGQMAMDMNYLNNGNISTKTNMGLYSYDSNGKPHAVSYIEASSEVQDDYQYIDYNAWNKAEEIYNSLGGDGYTYEIEYGPDGQRVMSRMYRNGNLYCRKFYWGEYEEIYFYSNSETVRTYWVEAPDGLAGMFWTSTSDYYTVVHPNVAMTDHLGSLTGLYDYDGSKVFDASYDAWGKRTLSPNSFTFIARGYTGHEHLDELGLINMNGRMYDPRQGRFLSPDPFVQAPSNPQNYNRYSYCLNNPLKYTDPSGEIIVIDDAIVACIIVATASVAIDYGTQVAINYLSGYKGADAWFKKVDFFDIAVSAIVGAATAGYGAAAKAGSKIGKVGKWVNTHKSIIKGGEIVLTSTVDITGEGVQDVSGDQIVSRVAIGLATQVVSDAVVKQTKGNSIIKNETVKQETIDYPPYDGKLEGISVDGLIDAGTELDRFGGTGPDSRYLSVSGTDISKRSLPPFTNLDIRDVFYVQQSFKANISFAAPYYGQPGGGIQIITNEPINKLVKDGYLLPLKPY